MEAATLTPANLEHVVNPKILSPEQQELISIHNRLDHIPFPHFIKTAEQGKIPRRLRHLKNTV